MTTPPTLALLPGLMCDAAFYAPQRPAFERLMPVHVADFSTQDSLGAMAQSVLDAVEGPLAVIGHSMGGRVALELMRRGGERVKALAVLDTGIHTLQPGEPDKRAAMVRLAYDEGMEALCARWLPGMVHPDRVNEEALIAPMRAMVLRASPEQHERQIRALVNRPDPAPLLPNITCPTLVMVGRQDAWSPVAQHEDIAARIPGAKLVVIEECGHMALMEQPQACEDALVGFLKEAIPSLG